MCVWGGGGGDIFLKNINYGFNDHTELLVCCCLFCV